MTYFLDLIKSKGLFLVFIFFIMLIFQNCAKWNGDLSILKNTAEKDSVPDHNCGKSKTDSQTGECYVNLACDFAANQHIQENHCQCNDGFIGITSADGRLTCGATPTCNPDSEIFSADQPNSCVSRCSTSETFNVSTKTCDCKSGYERYDGKCVVQCKANEMRKNGVCIERLSDCEEETDAGKNIQQLSLTDDSKDSKCKDDNEKCADGQVELNGECVNEVKCKDSEAKINDGNGFRCIVNYCENLPGPWHIHTGIIPEAISLDDFSDGTKFCGRFIFKDNQQNGVLKIKTDATQFENHWIKNNGMTLHVYQLNNDFEQEKCKKSDFEIKNFTLHCD